MSNSEDSGHPSREGKRTEVKAEMTEGQMLGLDLHMLSLRCSVLVLGCAILELRRETDVRNLKSEISERMRLLGDKVQRKKSKPGPEPTLAKRAALKRCLGSS